MGLDPGFSAIGWSMTSIGVDAEKVEAMGVIRTSKSAKKRKVAAADDNIRRAREITREFVELIDKYQPIALCCEAMSFPRNSSSAAKMALTWGVLVALADRYNIPIYQSSPQEIKDKVTGRKDASKEQVERALRKRYKGTAWAKILKSVPASMRDHAYDGLAATVAVLDTEPMILLRRFVK